MPVSDGVRRGLVLGAGGVLGGTWSVGALRAMEQDFGFRAGDAELIVGTSAGSVLAALLGSGVTVDQLVGWYRGEPVTEGPLVGLEFDPESATGGPRPGMPRFIGPGSPRLIGSTLRHPRQVSPTAMLSAFLPEGRKTLDRVGHLIEAVSPFGEWASRSGIWITAMDYDDGRRVVFGRPGAPVVPLASAVMASCSIPGWFAPVMINGRPYVDGGAVSATAIDVLAHAGLDEVYVVAPMVSFAMDRPRSVTARVERRWRAEVTRTARREAAVVRATGTVVRMIGPGPEDLTVIGANMMDDSRRLQVLETSLQTSSAAWDAAEATAAAG